MGQAAGVGPDETLDVVITNALIVDYTGIYKADVGLKGTNIVGIGKAGNPDVMDGVTPGMVVRLRACAAVIQPMLRSRLVCQQCYLSVLIISVLC